MINCLLIEDNSFDRKALRRAAAGCELKLQFHEASNIRSAEKILKVRSFDCIILDFLLPDEDGLSFAKRFLATAERQSPVIMLTGNGNEQVMREAFQLGILDYLNKANLSPEILERGVINAIAKVQVQRARQAFQDELKRSNEALRRFATFVAHDLKAPLDQIKMSCDAMREKYRNCMDNDGEKLLHRTERAAQRAYNLIDSMLGYAQLGRPSQRSDRVDLQSVLSDVTADLASQIEAAGATIQTGILPTVPGIEPQLTQLFQNLINNALKFRDRDRALVVRLRARAASRKVWEISVEDNGIGIAPDSQERIFNMLERLHSKDRYEGSGVGLAACRRIVENHGGQIWCRSTPGVGSAFVFTLSRQGNAAAVH